MLIFKKIFIIISLFTILNLIAGCTHIPNPPQESQESTETINETTEPTDSYTMVMVGHLPSYNFKSLSDFYLYAEDPLRPVSDYAIRPSNTPPDRCADYKIPPLLRFEDIFPKSQAAEGFVEEVVVHTQGYSYLCFNDTIRILVLKSPSPSEDEGFQEYDGYYKLTDMVYSRYVVYGLKIEPDFSLYISFNFTNEEKYQNFIQTASIPQLVSIYEGDQEAIDAFVATVKQLGSGNSEQ